MPHDDPTPPSLFLGDPERPVELAVELVTAYVTHNDVPTNEIPSLLRQTHAGIMALGTPGAIAPGHHAPAVRPERSVFPDRLISLIDGRPYKGLRRHIAVHGYSPATYREAFGLPADYPMVCSDYSAQRADVAKRSGFGKRAKA